MAIIRCNPDELSQALAVTLLKELDGRRGLTRELDTDIRAEIRDALAAHVRKALLTPPDDERLLGPVTVCAQTRRDLRCDLFVHGRSDTLTAWFLAIAQVCDRHPHEWIVAAMTENPKGQPHFRHVPWEGGVGEFLRRVADMGCFRGNALRCSNDPNAGICVGCAAKALAEKLNV